MDSLKQSRSLMLSKAMCVGDLLLSVTSMHSLKGLVLGPMGVDIRFQLREKRRKGADETGWERWEGRDGEGKRKG